MIYYQYVNHEIVILKLLFLETAYLQINVANLSHIFVVTLYMFKRIHGTYSFTPSLHGFFFENFTRQDQSWWFAIHCLPR